MRGSSCFDIETRLVTTAPLAGEQLNGDSPASFFTPPFSQGLVRPPRTTNGVIPPPLRCIPEFAQMKGLEVAFCYGSLHSRSSAFLMLDATSIGAPAAVATCSGDRSSNFAAHTRALRAACANKLRVSSTRPAPLERTGIQGQRQGLCELPPNEDLRLARQLDVQAGGDPYRAGSGGCETRTRRPAKRPVRRSRGDRAPSASLRRRPSIPRPQRPRPAYSIAAAAPSREVRRHGRL